jgi:hypothetical protein
MKCNRLLMIFLAGCILISCSPGGTHRLMLRYQPAGKFPDLQQKVGLTVGIVPVKDRRPDTLYIGLHDPYSGSFSYFKGTPSPDKAIQESLDRVLPPYGIKVVPMPAWDGRPESLKDLDVDSILMIEIKRFWIEGRGSLLTIDVQTAATFLFHLGVKRDMKVYTRTVEVEKERELVRLTPETAEEMMNQLLAEILDAYFSNPY